MNTTTVEKKGESIRPGIIVATASFRFLLGTFRIVKHALQPEVPIHPKEGGVSFGLFELGRKTMNIFGIFEGPKKRYNLIAYSPSDHRLLGQFKVSAL